jgi:hypothetical protein
VTVGRLSALQGRLLALLAGIEPPWTLGGGAALAAVHTLHRQTRDLDLFWNGRRKLEGLAETVKGQLTAAGLEVEVLQTEPAFARLRVSEQEETVVLDLIAEPSPSVEPPGQVDVGGVTIYVATSHELLVEKMCALLGRLELRDLIDVKVLLESGGDLGRALSDAPRKDAGFSPLAVAWVLRELAIDSVAQTSGVDPGKAHDLTVFRDRLVEQIMRLAGPA